MARTLYIVNVTERVFGETLFTKIFLTREHAQEYVDELEENYIKAGDPEGKINVYKDDNGLELYKCAEEYTFDWQLTHEGEALEEFPVKKEFKKVNKTTKNASFVRAVNG